MNNDILNVDDLNYAISNGIIDLKTIESIGEEVKMLKRKEIIKNHPYSIWQNKRGAWCTYVEDKACENSRRQISRKDKNSLYDEIVRYHQLNIESPYFFIAFYEWLNRKYYKYKEIKKDTYDKYENDFKRYFKKIENVRMSDFDDIYLEDFIKVKIADEQLTAKSYASMRTILLGTFKYSKKKGYTDMDIVHFFANIDIGRKSFKKKKKNKDTEVFQEDEMKLMANYIKNNPTIRNLGILFDMQTGLRVGELAAIKKEDVFLEDKVIHIHRMETHFKDEDGKCIVTVVDDVKTDAGDRDILLTEEALKTVKEIMKLNPSSEWLIAEGNKRITVNGFSHKIKRICKAVGIPERSMHKIRKSYATMLLDARVDEAFIKEQMGHSDIKTTRTYYYYSNKDKIKRLEQLDSAMYF